MCVPQAGVVLLNPRHPLDGLRLVPPRRDFWLISGISLLCIAEQRRGGGFSDVLVLHPLSSHDNDATPGGSDLARTRKAQPSFASSPPCLSASHTCEPVHKAAHTRPSKPPVTLHLQLSRTIFAAKHQKYLSRAAATGHNGTVIIISNSTALFLPAPLPPFLPLHRTRRDSRRGLLRSIRAKELSRMDVLLRARPRPQRVDGRVNRAHAIGESVLRLRPQRSPGPARH